MAATPPAQALWRARLGLRRAGLQWQLLAVVAGIAVLASTLVTSLTLLVTATELGAVRGALSETTGIPAVLQVTLLNPLLPTTVPEERSVRAMTRVLGDAATATSDSIAVSGLHPVPGADKRTRLLYFGEVESVGDNAVLVEGSWPQAGSSDQVALPSAGAAAMSLGVGDTLQTNGIGGSPAVTMLVTGLYDASPTPAGYWGVDRLGGQGLDPNFAVPGTAGAVRTDLIGPAVLAPGALEAAAIPVERLDIRLSPDFAGVTVESLDRLAVRLAAAPTLVPTETGEVARSVEYTSGLDTVVRGVTSAMAVTRSTVVAVSLLLLVLAIAALSQAARLLTEARAGERHLMRARGATSAQLLQLAATEAAIVAGGAGAASVLLANVVYRLVAAQPAMAAAGMPEDPGLPTAVWVVAVLTASLFGFVLVAPLLRRDGSFHEGEQGTARQQRFSGLQRSGLDLALVVLAVIAYWQLLGYQGSSAGAVLGLDPVLVAGPTLIMLAGALVAVRLVPTTARLAERIAERSRGAVVALAAWEVGRRAQRATAAILLLTLGLAIGTFSYAFLSTWRQSQVDQAAFALGAPLRLSANGDGVSVPAGAQPVVRLEGKIAAADSVVTNSSEPSGKQALILGLTTESRALLERGRLGDSGGSVVADSLEAPDPLAPVFQLPDGTTGLAATVTAEPDSEIDGVLMRIRLLVQDSDGAQSLVTLGTVPIGASATPLAALLPDGTSPDGLAIIGYQVQAFIQNPDLDGSNQAMGARVLVGDLAALGSAPAGTAVEDYPKTAIASASIEDWRAGGEGAGTKGFPKPNFKEGTQLGLTLTIPASLASRTVAYALTAWPTVTEVPAVLSAALADETRIEVGDRQTLVIGGSTVAVKVTGIAPAVPGSASSASIGPLGGGSGGTGQVVVVDEALLARALFQSGSVVEASEWWMDVAARDSTATAARLAESHPALRVQSAQLLGVEMQQHPVRVATQAALWLVIAGAIALATAGFAVHATGSLRSRATEFAQLRAVGLTRRRLVGIIGLESLLLCLLGVILGVALGLGLAWLVGPLVGVSADGSPPVPAVQVLVPAADVAAMVGLLGVVLAVVVLVAARAQRVAEPATALRQGEER